MNRREVDLLVNRLRNSTERIMHRERIATFTKHPLEEALEALRRHGWITYVFEGYYYLLDADERYAQYTNYTDREMLFTVLNKQQTTWYLGLSSALEHHSIIWQSHRTITIINDRISGERTVRNLHVRFRKAKDEYLFGYESFRTKSRITGHVSDTNKTLVDYAYFNEKAPLELREVVDPETVRTHLNSYPTIVKKRTLT